MKLSIVGYFLGLHKYKFYTYLGKKGKEFSLYSEETGEVFEVQSERSVVEEDEVLVPRAYLFTKELEL